MRDCLIRKLIYLFLALAAVVWLPVFAIFIAGYSLFMLLWNFEFEERKI